MFESKSPMVKIGSYVIMGFLTIIIIISFGMPDFMSRMGLDQSTVAVVNGEKIHYLDFLRFRDNFARRMKDVSSKEVQMYILDSLIRYRLQLQKANELGIKVSDERVKGVIRSLPMFQDKNGQFSNEYLKNFLNHMHLALSDYYRLLKDDLVNNELMLMMRMGIGVSSEEIMARSAIENSRIQIRYSFVPNADLRNRFRAQIAVSDQEIEQELSKNKAEIKDPKTDRERVRKKIEDRKFEKVKRDITDQVDKMAFDGQLFEAAAAYLGGTVSVSNVFKIGEPVKEGDDKGKIVDPISDSKIFREDCLAIDMGRTSRLIAAFNGLYIFTPVKKSVEIRKLSAAEYDQMSNRLISEKTESLYMVMMTQFIEKSKIIKNLKFN